MNKRTRRISFILAVLIFLITTPLLILKSQGFRIDFENRKITQTGAFYFKVNPGKVDIYLNEKIKEKTDFLFKSILIENIIPKKYKTRVEKEGFFSWEKELEIVPKIVTEIKDLILIPKNPEISMISNNIVNFWKSPNEKEIIFLEKQLKDVYWSLKLYDLEKGLKSHLISEEEISTKGVDVIDIKISDKKALLKTGNKEQIKYFILDFEKEAPVISQFKLLKSGDEKAIFNPTDNKKILFLRNNYLFEYDIQKEIVLPIMFSEFNDQIITYKNKDHNFYFLGKSGKILKTNQYLKEESFLSSAPFQIKNETKYSIEIFKDFTFLIENKKIYLLDQETKSFEEFFDNFSFFTISPDQTKLAFLSNYEVWILFLEDKENQIKRSKGEKQFIMRISQPIDNLEWINNHYFAFSSEDKIKISEIDMRDKLNIVEITETKDPNIFWINSKKQLVIFGNKTLFLYSFPLF